MGHGLRSRLVCLAVCCAAAFMATSASAQRQTRTDFFDRAPLHPAWTFHAPDGGRHEFRDGWLHLVAPGRLSLNPHEEDSIAPMLLIEPPAGGPFSFETRLQWIVAGAHAPAGLVAIRKDLSTSMALRYMPLPFGTVRLYWWDGLEGRGGGALTVFPLGHDLEDIWLRVEMIGRGDAFSRSSITSEAGKRTPGSPPQALEGRTSRVLRT